MKRRAAQRGRSLETDSDSGRERAEPPLGVIVRVLNAPASPPSFRLAEGTCRIGAGPQCDLVIDHPKVSRSHVELALVPEGISVRDLGSRNGTSYLGQRLEAITLSPGARLQLGPVEVGLDPDLESLAEGAIYPGTSYRGLIGVSLSMRALFRALVRLEGSLVTVLVTGESGVGKELIARALHEGSSVAEGPFVAVNCGAIAPELVGSELFGHRRGAFTGAVAARRGAFEAADRGTLFLDEIAELPLETQPVLLRALESGEINPLGADNPRKVGVRVVAATNKDVRSEVRAGRFREDLYYRVAVVELGVPPLRERVDDVEPLARLFAEAAGKEALPRDVIERLRARRWPGNVRELRNVVQAWSALGRVPPEGAALSGDADEALLRLIDMSRPYSDQKDDLLERFTHLYLVRLMDDARGNQSAAARISGIDRSWLWRLLLKHGLIKG